MFKAESGRSSAVRLLTRISALLAMLILVLSFTTPAVAMDSRITGVVTAVDTYSGTLVVRPADNQPSAMAMTEYTFVLRHGTRVVLCDQNSTVENLGIGQRVTVTYHEQDGKTIADRIDISAPPAPVIVACNLD